MSSPTLRTRTRPRRRKRQMGTEELRVGVPKHDFQVRNAIIISDDPLKIRVMSQKSLLIISPSRYFQAVRGYSPAESGYKMLPVVSVAIITPFSIKGYANLRNTLTDHILLSSTDY